MCSYLDKRDSTIDRTEWVDIYLGLTAVGINPHDTIIELCAGKGYLIDYLRKRLPYNKYIGVDLEGCMYNKEIKCMDLNKELPPRGDFYIFQHCIEHLDQDRVITLFMKILHEWKAKAVIGIVPGHLCDDPTHVVNHYHLRDLEELIKKIDPPYYYIRPDIMSYVEPNSMDYLVILSNVPFDPRKTFPKIMRYGLLFFRKTVLFILNRYIGG